MEYSHKYNKSTTRNKWTLNQNDQGEKSPSVGIEPINNNPF